MACYLFADPQSSMTVTTGKFNDKSIKFTWAIDNARCMGYIEEFTLKVVGLPFGRNQSLNVPKSCFNISSGKVTFDTSHPCSNVTVDPCSNYFIEITPKLFSNVYSLTGNNANTSILPGRLHITFLSELNYLSEMQR
jgi:hypothetical protein